MKLGVCYYPEQWPPERWRLDAQQMRQAGLALVRIADFAWSSIEPREGEFTWEWLDQVVEILAAEGLQIILCTPTAGPPPWLSRTHPDTLPVDAQGRRRKQGGRRHYCPNNATYKRFTVRIVNELAKRYAAHPAVVGWQIDNELGWAGTTYCYCEACTRAFRGWLQVRYGTPLAVNAAWGTVFWGQTYQQWNEIDLPNLTVGEPNPSHVLDYYRFSSDSIRAYQQLQLETLLPLIATHQLLTTNFMCQFSDLNYYDLAQPLDLVSVSSYPTGQAEAKTMLYMRPNGENACAYDVGDPYVTGFWHTLMRGFKPGRPFWVLEQQCGNINWSQYNTGVRPGTVRLWTWHALASGAEAVVYFRWRAGRFAQEQLHSGLLHHDASPAVGLGDLERMKADRALMAEITAQPYQAQVAFLLDYDSLWALRLQPHHCEMDTLRHLFVYYQALQRQGIPADIVGAGADLSQYKLVILPTAYVATDALAEKLWSFTQAGGTVLLGVRSGFKTPSNLVTEQSLPGPFRELAGVRVEEWQSLPPGVSYDLSSCVPGLVGPAMLWAEALEPAASEMGDANLQVLAHYSSGPFCPKAALVEHKVGSGQALYLGWYPNEQQAEAILAYIASKIGLLPIAIVPYGLVASRRGPYVILLNFTDKPLMANVNERTVLVEPRDVVVVKTVPFHT